MAEAGLQAEAYQRLYPAEYYASFLEKGIRPDGRLLSQARPVTLALGVVGSAPSSALARVGGTSALAGVRAEVASPDLEVPEEGYLDVQVRGVGAGEEAKGRMRGDTAERSARWRRGCENMREGEDEESKRDNRRERGASAGVLGARISASVRRSVGGRACVLSAHRTPLCDAPSPFPLRLDLSQVEIAPMAAPEARPGQSLELSSTLTERVSSLLTDAGAVDLRDLCIGGGRAAWAVRVDVLLLSSDGGELEAALLAALGAIAGLSLEAVHVTEEGNVVRDEAQRGEGPAAGEGAAEAANAAEDEEGARPPSARRNVLLRAFPHVLTVALHGSRMVVDPTAEETRLADGTVDVALRHDGSLLAASMPAGGKVSDRSSLAKAMAAAELSRREVFEAIKESLPRGVPGLTD